MSETTQERVTLHVCEGCGYKTMFPRFASCSCGSEEPSPRNFVPVDHIPAHLLDTAIEALREIEKGWPDSDMTRERIEALLLFAASTAEKALTTLTNLERGTE